MQRARRTYVLLFNKNGVFYVEKVPPGNYELEIAPKKPANGLSSPIPMEPIGTIKMNVTVPEGGDEQNPIDLGTLSLGRNKQ